MPTSFGYQIISTLHSGIQTIVYADRFLVYQNGNVVWTVSTFNIRGTLKNGSPIRRSGRNTLVWERVGNPWLIGHEHVSTLFVPQSK